MSLSRNQSRYFIDCSSKNSAGLVLCPKIKLLVYLLFTCIQLKITMSHVKE